MVSHSHSVSPNTQDLPLFFLQVHQYTYWCPLLEMLRYPNGPFLPSGLYSMRPSLCPLLEMLRYPNGPFLPSGLYSMRPSVINLDKSSSPTLILHPLPCFIFLLSISEYMVYIFFFNCLPHWNVSYSVVGLLLLCLQLYFQCQAHSS